MKNATSISVLALVSLLGACGATSSAATSSAAPPATTARSEAPPDEPSRDATPSAHGRPDVVPGPAVTLRFAPAPSARLRVEGFVAFQLARGSAGLTDTVSEWRLDDRSAAPRALEEQLLSAHFHSGLADGPMAYVGAPDGQRLRWTFDERAQVSSEPEVLASGDPSRLLAEMQLPEIVLTRIAFTMPADPARPGDAWSTEDVLEIPTQFAHWRVTYRLAHELIRVADDRADVWLEGTIDLPAEERAGITHEGHGETWGLVSFRLADGVPVALDLREAVQVSRRTSSGPLVPDPVGWERRITLTVSDAR